MPNIAKPIRVIETLSTALLVSAKLQPKLRWRDCI
jgi:hypothetical protein